MRIQSDIYTKTILTIIAVLLAVSVMRPVVGAFTEDRIELAKVLKPSTRTGSSGTSQDGGPIGANSNDGYKGLQLVANSNKEIAAATLRVAKTNDGIAAAIGEVAKAVEALAKATAGPAGR